MCSSDLMATQHPDHASVPFWKHDGNPFISAQDEVEECFINFKELKCQEFMWDWEGKHVDEAVVERLFSDHYDFFKRHRLGRDLFLTFRLPNIWLEKGYRLWGADMSADYTPLEAGLERFVALDKGDFVGREALERQIEEGGPRIRLSSLVVDADDADAHAYEPVYRGGELVSYVMAGGYGHAVGRSIALAYLPVEHAGDGTELEVEILGTRRPACVVEQSLYDPAGERLRM